MCIFELQGLVREGIVANQFQMYGMHAIHPYIVAYNRLCAEIIA